MSLYNFFKFFFSCADGVVPRPSIPQKNNFETPYLGPNLESRNNDILFSEKKINKNDFSNVFSENFLLGKSSNKILKIRTTDNSDQFLKNNNSYSDTENNENQKNIANISHNSINNNNNNDNNNNHNLNNSINNNNINNDNNNHYNDNNNHHNDNNDNKSNSYDNNSNINIKDINNNNKTMKILTENNKNGDFDCNINYSEIYLQDSKRIVEQTNFVNTKILNHIIEDIDTNYVDKNTDYDGKNTILSPQFYRPFHAEVEVEKEVVVASLWFKGVDLVPIEKTLPLSPPLSQSISHSLSSSNFEPQSPPLSLPLPSPLIPSSTTSFSTSFPKPLSTAILSSVKTSVSPVIPIVSENIFSVPQNRTNLQKCENNSQIVRAVDAEKVLTENEKLENFDENVKKKKKRKKEEKSIEMDKEEKRKKKEEKKAFSILNWLDNIGVPIVDVGQRTSFMNGEILILDCGKLLCHVLQKLDYARKMKENNNNENKFLTEIDHKNEKNPTNNHFQNNNKNENKNGYYTENKNEIDIENENENEDCFELNVCTDDFHSFCLDAADEIRIFQKERKNIKINGNIKIFQDESENEENENEELKKLERVQRALSFIAVRTSSSTLLSTCLSKEIRFSLLNGNSQVLLRLLNSIRKAYSPKN